MEKVIRLKLKKEVEADNIAHFVQIANQFVSKVYLDVEDVCRVNAKSIMGMMNLPWRDGLDITIQAEGSDEEKAVETIAAFLTGNW